MRFFDVHAHLDLLGEKEVKEQVRKAREKNVFKIVSCSTSFSSNKKNILLAKEFEEIITAIGLYPLNALELNEKELEKVFGWIEKNVEKSRAIGEVGLDFKYSKKNDEKDKQERVFKRFVEISKKHKKPLIVHSRYAQRRVLEILEEEKAEKVLLHSFTESEKLARRAFENNWFVGVGANLLKDEQVQERVRKMPLEGLLFETDAPIIRHDERIMPEKIVEIAEKTSSLKKIEIEKVAEQQEKNFEKLFGNELNKRK